MVQILPETPGFASQLGKALGGVLSSAGQGYGQGKVNAAQFAQKLKLEEAKKRSMIDAMENEKFTTGLETLQAMREIASKRNIGRGSAFAGFFPGETAEDRAEFAQLGKSLIPLVAAGVPIRNQKEFEEYKKVITDPSSPLSEIEGAISGLERIFESKLKGEEKIDKKTKKIKFDSSNPEHKAKAQQLYKTFKNKEKVRQALQREFEGV